MLQVTNGGAGGPVIVVSTTADSGAGSLRAALTATGPRIVTFDPALDGEIISLSNHIDIQGQCTIDASMRNITVKGGRLRVVGSDVLIMNLRVRPGDGPGGNGGDRDGISIGASGKVVERVHLFSCSVSWAVDESIACWGGPKDVVIEDCIAAECLNASINPDGLHSMGVFIADGSQNVTVVGCLLAHNQWRNPSLAGPLTNVQFINNVIYNFGDEGAVAYGQVTGAIVSNVFRKGPDTNLTKSPIVTKNLAAGASVFVVGNFHDIPGVAMVDGPRAVVSPYPMRVSPMLGEDEILTYVMDNAGAWPRDNTDQRIIDSYKARTGKVINSQTEVGGYDTTLVPAPPPPDPAPEPTPGYDDTELRSLIAALEARIVGLEANQVATDAILAALTARMNELDAKLLENDSIIAGLTATVNTDTTHIWNLENRLIAASTALQG